MCRDAGFAHFVERDADVVTICVNGGVEKYEIVRVIEFTSERKRMSVIVRRVSDG